MRLPGDAWHRRYTDPAVVRKLKLKVLGFQPAFPSLLMLKPADASATRRSP